MPRRDARLEAILERPSYWLTRFVILRSIGAVYLVAFLMAAFQVLPLAGQDGLTPVGTFLAGLEARAGSRLGAFASDPSVFWIDASDGALIGVAWIGVALSIPVVLGFANAIVMALLWALYMSFVHVGQEWYGFGWEIQLLETGFLAIFLCPLVDPRPFPRRPPPEPVVWLLRWLVFRIMLGAGLIKLRGDPCWRDLTCLDFHYETQPIPNPLSRWFHFHPHGVHAAGVLFNHLTELVAPWLAFGPGLARHAAGSMMLAFQATLILSGNLSFLNYLTIVPILACFDDRWLRRWLPRRLETAAERAAAQARESASGRLAVAGLVALVGVLSIEPARNLVSPRQVMNSSFGALDLVNTYGAFGAVGRARDEIVFEGTGEETISGDTRWTAYELPCKPGDPMRRPCLASPYHYRLDWLLWFAAMGTPADYPWTVHLVWKLLHGDPRTLGLLAANPFPDRPPRYVRALLYRYRFTPPDDPAGAWWRRELVGEWLPPLTVDDPRLRRFLREHGWAS